MLSVRNDNSEEKTLAFENGEHYSAKTEMKISFFFFLKFNYESLKYLSI